MLPYYIVQNTHEEVIDVLLILRLIKPDAFESDKNFFSPNEQLIKTTCSRALHLL